MYFRQSSIMELMCIYTWLVQLAYLLNKVYDGQDCWVTLITVANIKVYEGYDLFLFFLLASPRPRHPPTHPSCLLFLLLICFLLSFKPFLFQLLSFKPFLFQLCQFKPYKEVCTRVTEFVKPLTISVQIARSQSLYVCDPD